MTTNIPTRFSPSWLHESGPRWCVRTHAEDDHEEDRFHQSEPALVPLVASRADSARYTCEQELVSDIGVSMPLIGNAYEVVGGPHLVGHPNENLQHYVEIRGYHQTGAQTNDEDSIHGNTQVGWYASVPAYSQMSSATFATILGDRGYVW